MPLSEMYRTMLEASNPAVWEANRQKQLMGEYELESKRRDMADEQRLRDLYAGSAEPSIRDVMAIRPELGIKLIQAQNEQYLKSLQAQKTKGEVDLQAADAAAAAAFPAYITYQENKQRGMPEEQALNYFHAMNGDAVSKAAQAGESWVKSGTSYDPKSIKPDDVRALNARFGRFSPLDKFHQESQLEAMKTGYGIQQKQTPSFSDRYFIGPDGLPHPNPYFQGNRMPSRSGARMPSGGQGPYSEEAPYQFTTPGGQDIKVWDLGTAAQALQELPEGPEKEALSKWIDEQWANARNPQKVKTKQELAIEEETGKERAKLQVQDEQDAENKLSTIASMPPDDEVLKYLRASTLGKGEEILKGPVASFFHVENEAQAADTVLSALQENIKNIATKAKGDMNMKEVDSFNAAVGALNNPNLGPEARYGAYTVAKNMAIKKIALKHPEIAKKYGMGTAMQQGQQQEAPEGTKKPITFKDGSKGEAIMTNGKWEAHRL